MGFAQFHSSWNRLLWDACLGDGLQYQLLGFFDVFFFLGGGERVKFFIFPEKLTCEWKHLKMEGFKTFSFPFGGVSSYFQGLLLLGKSECKDVFFSGRRVDISWIFMVPNLPPTCFGENSIEIPCELPCWTEGTISAWTSSGSICVLAERMCVPARRHAPFSNWWFQLGIFLAFSWWNDPIWLEHIFEWLANTNYSNWRAFFGPKEPQEISRGFGFW